MQNEWGWEVPEVPEGPDGFEEAEAPEGPKAPRAPELSAQGLKSINFTFSRNEWGWEVSEVPEVYEVPEGLRVADELILTIKGRDNSVLKSLLCSFRTKSMFSPISY